MTIVQLLSVAVAWTVRCGCMTEQPNLSDTLSVVEAAGAEEDRLVVVRGYLVFGSHARQLWLSKNAFGRGKIKSCLTLVETGPHRQTLTQNSNRIVIITGRVRRDVTTGFVDYGACNKVGIAIESVNVRS